VTALEGTNIQARVRDASGNGLTLVARLQINEETGAAAGSLSASP
jgi:hypothetical protein